jgi:tryptophan synthase alpha chain
MSRLENLFQTKEKDVLNIYFTAGFPELNSVMPIMEALEANGADIIELGMPYSDPLADGPVIQQSSQTALANGMNLDILFAQLKGMRSAVSIPVILMGYMNPVLQFGFERFCRMAEEVGIDGLILPDLPAHEFEHFYEPVMKKYGLDMIFLVAPETSDERVKKLDSLSTGFLYAVSSSSITGSTGSNTGFEKYIDRLLSLSLKNPVLVGFGISDKAGFQKAAARTNGGIIGSAFIKALSKGGDVKATTKDFLSSILR